MDASTASDFGRLTQYGAVGVVAAGLLALVVGLFRQFVNHALKQNSDMMERHDKLLERQALLQEANVRALNGIEKALHDVQMSLSREFADLFKELSAIVEGSRVEATGRHRIKPRGGGSG